MVINQFVYYYTIPTSCNIYDIYMIYMRVCAQDITKFCVYDLNANPYLIVIIPFKIDPSHPLVCRKMRLNGAVLRMRLENPWP